MSALRLGRIVHRRGYVTQLPFVRGKSGRELDRLIGYRAGRMADGWALLELIEMPGPDDFEFRGYSHLSGGIAAGESRTAEGRLRDGGYDVAKLKRDVIASKFRVTGPSRLVKVVPNRVAFGGDDYPPGAGIPQWELKRDLAFRVAALIAKE